MRNSCNLLIVDSQVFGDDQGRIASRHKEIGKLHQHYGKKEDAIQSYQKAIMIIQGLPLPKHQPRRLVWFESLNRQAPVQVCRPEDDERNKMIQENAGRIERLKTLIQLLKANDVHAKADVREETDTADTAGSASPQP